jgi:hypothetical protein
MYFNLLATMANIQADLNTTMSETDRVINSWGASLLGKSTVLDEKCIFALSPKMENRRDGKSALSHKHN